MIHCTVYDIDAFICTIVHMFIQVCYSTHLSRIQCCWDRVLQCSKVLFTSLQMQSTPFRKVLFFLGSISLGRGIRCGTLNSCAASVDGRNTRLLVHLVHFSSSASVMTFRTSRYFACALLVLRPDRCHPFA